MTFFILKRLAQSLLVMAVVSAISFSLFNFVGDPVNNMVGQDATREQRIEIRQKLGLDDPILTQYTRFMGNILSGDFGLSYRIKRPVDELILERLPATLELVFVSAIIALAVGITLGVYTGIRRKSWVSRVILSTSLIGVSLPTFIIGIALIYVFAVHLRWLPSSGRSGTVDLGWWKTSLLTSDGWRAIVLPAITLSLFQLTLILRLVRAEMMEVMRTDFIKFARARGLSERAVNFRHALRNTLVPVITIIGLNIGGLIAFSVITETVFQWPGTGLMFIQAVDFVDVPIMAAYLVFVALLFVLINLIVDILYFVVDPRIRLGS
ncbi:MAG: ABC transporter permease [Pseudophaeobacter sp. bin_em_oilr2.035]|uniref:ABC transporter permease n=1 Tax=Phaeobacter gallaeciensis TaxID=60890 RepID=A0ABD4X5R5_9RHOB|nr:ABC transporter permease [Phaeobacter gallaeciensis]MDF1771420.1 ABC transporter permease [Pseudophaeobacter sp. bin_em_oilr2.035]MDE4143650.1 ABC transporter permease [Phaeobacter gallaeciensis]MDE4155988.1 ABC transporter permease [Phaeobacter gallaeciensis]MDE4160176.1 ABC transporter permease [Phaeobacter gallaeciensis]MDE4164730.1 ABC transporter permease [Phaeobacter gallaeciensis]